MPKISVRITVRKNKKPFGTPNAATVDVNDDYEAFREKLHDKIIKKVDIDPFGDYSIKLYASWRSKTSVQGAKKPLQVGDFLSFGDEDDYEGIVQEIRATHNSSKTGLDKMVLCILAIVIVDGSGPQDEDPAMLELSSPMRKTVLFLSGIFFF